MDVQHSLKSIADYLGASLQGDPEKVICGIADIQAAGSEQIAFVAKKQFEQYLQSTQAGAVIVGTKVDVPNNLNAVRVDNPYLAYAKLTGLFVRRQRPSPGIHPSAVVDPSAQVADSVSIGPNCVVEAGVVLGSGTVLSAGVSIGAESSIGENCLLYPGVVVYHGVRIGHRVTLHANAVIGADGFGFAPSASGWQKIHQLGGVEIGDDVEIGAHTAIDRGAIHATKIGDGVIIDNLVHVAHNVIIGRYTAIAACTGIAGSTSIGERCTIGGQCGISGHLTIVDDVHLHGGTVVLRSINEPGHYASSTSAHDMQTWRRNTVRFTQLDEWIDRLKKLEQAKDQSA